MSTKPQQDAIKAHLQSKVVAEMRDMARKRGVKLPTGPRDAIVEIMAANLSDPAANRAVINSLTPELRQTLDLLAWNGFMRFPDLTALVQPWKIERTSEEVAADLHQLGGYGLAFMPSGTGYIISPAVVNLTPVALPAPVQPKTPPSFSSPDAVAPHTLDALVIALASYVMTHPVRLTVSSRWDQPLPQSGAAIAAVRTRLDLPGDLLSAFPDVPPVTWELALALLLHTQIMTTTTTSSVNRQSLLELAGQAPAVRLNRLFAAWQALGSWGEWRLLEQQKRVEMVVQPSFVQNRQIATPAGLDNTCLADRATLLRLLERLTPGQWYLSRDLTHAMSQLSPNFPKFSQEPAWGLALAGHTTALKRDSDAWQIGLGAFIEQWLHGPLTWLGGLAWRGDFFSLTPLGAWLLDLETAPPSLAAPHTGLQVMDDGKLKIAVASTDQEAWGTVFHSAALALDQPQPAADGSLLFRVQPDLLAISLDQGADPAAILAGLERGLGGSSAAQRLLQTVQHWLGAYGRIRIFENIARLDLADDFALQEILAGALPAPLRPLTRTLAVIPDLAFDAVRDALIARGHTPTVISDLPKKEHASPAGTHKGTAP